MSFSFKVRKNLAAGLERVRYSYQPVSCCDRDAAGRWRRMSLRFANAADGKPGIGLDQTLTNVLMPRGGMIRGAGGPPPSH